MTSEMKRPTNSNTPTASCKKYGIKYIQMQNATCTCTNINELKQIKTEKLAKCQWYAVNV